MWCLGASPGLTAPAGVAARRSGPDLPRAAHDELGRDDGVLRRAQVAVDPREERAGDLASDPPDVLADHGQRRLEHVGEREVVEPHERHAVAQPALAERPYRTDRDGVACREHCRGRVLCVEESQRRDERVVARAQPRHAQVGGQAQGPLGQALLEPGETIGGSLDLREVTEEGDARMSLCRKVVGGKPGPVDVVDSDGVGVDALGAAVDEHHRQAVLHVGREVVLLRGRRHEDEAVHAAAHQAGHECTFALGLLVEARGQDRHPPVVRHVLEAAQQAGGKAVADVLQQGADGVGARVGTPQVAGREVVAVAQLQDCALDALADVGGDATLVVHHP